MANHILYKRHDCLFKESIRSTPIHKTQSTPQIPQRNALPIRRGIIRKLGLPVKKVHSSTNVVNPKPVNLQRRRSVSLTNLSLTQNIISDMSRPNPSGSEEKNVRVEMCCENLEPLVKTQCDLARNVYKMFILNAWRHRRNEAITAKYDLKQAETQMDNLNIQIVVLRNLLESEKTRVAISMNEAAHNRVMLEDAARQKDTLKNEIEEKENQLISMKKLLEDATTVYLNTKNELLTCKSEQAALEEQMDKEREKLAKFKEDKKLLIEKLKSAEESNTVKQTQINKLASENQELKQLLLVERENTKSKESCIKESLEKLNILEESTSYLSKEVTILKGTNSQLIERIKSLEVALTKKDKENICLTKSCQEQMLEMSHLRVSLNQQQTKNWTSRLSRFASVLVQVPISVLFYNINSPLIPIQS